MLCYIAVGFGDLKCHKNEGIALATRTLINDEFLHTALNKPPNTLNPYSADWKSNSLIQHLQTLRSVRCLALFGLITLSLYFIISMLTLRPSIAEERKISFWHWWNSAGEVKSIDVLSKYLTQYNLIWNKEKAIKSSTALYLRDINSLLETQSPDAAMMISSKIHNYDAKFSLMHLDDIAQEQGWDEVVPHAIQNSAKHNGHWVSAPINSHSTNWLWVNKNLFLRLNLPEPETWTDLIAVLERAKALNIPAIAALNDDWEQALLFELAVISTGGLEFYRRLFVNYQFSPDDKHILTQSFLRLEQLTHYFAESTFSNNWNQNSAMVNQGEVLMQIHGSWVNSELSALGAKPDIDYLCMRFPETQGAYLFHTDHVIFFNQQSSQPDKQKKMARMLLDKEFQRELSIASGASPSRVDISTDGFNSCSKNSIHDLRMANMRRAVLASLNHKDLYKIVADYLKQKTTTETAVNQVLTAITQQSISATSNSQ